MMKLFVLTGAGVSAESGLSTFRDASGIWTRYDFRDVATPEGFARDPALVHDFYNLRRANLRTCEPNAAHLALAGLERDLEATGGSLYLCTQNVDDLHERGGSGRVVHMHGELLKVRCRHCDDRRAWTGDLSVEIACQACGRVGGLRPAVVWFGEQPEHMDEIYDALIQADLFVSIGTSGSVYPAAGFVADARRAGVRTCEINLEPSENAHLFDERLYGAASEVVPRWADEILSRGRVSPVRGAD